MIGTPISCGSAPDRHESGAREHSPSTILPLWRNGLLGGSIPRALPPAPLPQHVIRFIREDIHSVLQLEVLLLLRERGGEWTPSTVAEELRITVQYAELRLQDLHLRGLLGPGSSPQAYVYAPTPESRRQLVDELAACYATTRYTVINLIFSEPGDSARSLADAFRFRRKKGE